MADIFVTELGDMLATNNLCDELGVNTLPSPTDLKQKILLKGKIKVKKKVKEYSLYTIDFSHPKTLCSTNQRSGSAFFRMISIPGFLAFAKLVMMSCAPTKSRLQSVLEMHSYYFEHN